MAPGKVISSIFLSRNKLLRVEELTISPCPDFINDSWFKINEYSSWHMLSSTSFAKERIKCIICNAWCGVTARKREKKKIKTSLATDLENAT